MFSSVCMSILQLFSKIEELEKKIDEKSLNKYSAKSSTKSKTSQKLVEDDAIGGEA